MNSLARKRRAPVRLPYQLIWGFRCSRLTAFHSLLETASSIFISLLIHLFSLFVTIRNYSSLFVTIHHYSSLFVTIHHYSSLFITIRHHSSLFVTIRHHSSLFVTIHHYSRLVVIIRHYSRLFAVFGRYSGSITGQRRQIEFNPSFVSRSRVFT